MATLEELVVRIKADASQLDQEFRRVSGTVNTNAKEMENSLSGVKDAFRELVPAIGVAAVIEFGKRSIEAAGHMNDLADRIGFAATTLSALEAKLVTNGASLDDFGNAINLMNANVGQAVSGNQEVIKAFDKLGLSVTSLKRLSPEDQFYAITDALAQVKNQFEQTEVGRAIFGRGFAALIPVIKESNGNLREHVDALKATGEALGPETIKRIDEFGDHMASSAIKAKNAFLEMFATILKVNDAIAASFGPGAAEGGFGYAKTGMPNSTMNQRAAMKAYLDKAGKGGFATTTGAADGYSFDAKGNLVKAGDKSAKGGNADVLKASGKAANDAAQDYDKLNGTLDDYVGKLEQQHDLLTMDKRDRAGMAAVYEAQAIAMKEGNLLTDDEIAKIKELGQANYDLQDGLKETQRFTQELHDKLSKGLADVVLDFNSATDAVKGFADQIARTIIQNKITGPLSNGILDLLNGGSGSTSGSSSSSSSGGLLSSIGSWLSGARAGGGPVTGGGSYLVGENGPEIFTPGGSGFVTPNGGSGGKQIVVNNSFQIYPGVEETVDAKIREAAPLISQHAQAGVFRAIERGGSEARSVGRRT